MGSAERVVRIEWGELVGTRPRPCGKNARLAAHGSSARIPLCRITTSSGLQGIGPSRIREESAYGVIGQCVSELLDDNIGGIRRSIELDYPLFDLMGKRSGLPVFQLVSHEEDLAGTEPPAVPCYDTALYFDDLGTNAYTNDHLAGAAIVAQEAAVDLARGHRAFKVKIGRGGRWMDYRDGLERDVAVVRAVRDAIGAQCELLVDANDGFTLSGIKEFLERSTECSIGWLEEPFHEDEVLLAALREWMDDRGISVAIADCESSSADEARRLATRGLLDIVQCDILDTGFGGWLQLGADLDAIGIGSAPHHFGLHLGNLVSGHLAAAIRGFRYVEWDEMTTPGLLAPGYEFRNGTLKLSEEPGFGIEVDEDLFVQAVREGGFDFAVS